MGHVLCQFNSVNGANTGVVTRRGTGASYPSAGTLLKKNCPNGQFYIESADGGTNNYYRLVNPEKYAGINASGPVYVWISSTFLVYPKPSEVKSKGATTNSNSGSSSQNSNTQQVQTQGQNVNTNTNNVGSVGYSQGLDDRIYQFLQSNKNQELIKQNTRVFGMPFQFTEIADYRPFKENNYDFGRKYLENIMAEAPIIYMTPGLPNYMPDADKKQKEQIDAFIKARSSNNEIDAKTLDGLSKIDQRYYGFVPAYTDYTRYVNLLCRICAIYMGLKGKTVPGTTTDYTKFDWARWTNFTYTETKDSEPTGVWDTMKNTVKTALTGISDKVLDDLFGEYKYVKCYVDPSASFSESSSNSSTSSQIEGLFDQLSSIVREVGFFSNGGGVLDSVASKLKSGASTTADNIEGALSSEVQTGLSNIIGNASHVIAGSNVVFPELWGGSQYDKSYSFTINLVSPYGDIESVYMNIIVPMMHLIALAMPRQTSANSFGSPFLVKMFAKGWFSCELGMVDSIRIDKDSSSWNVHGLPNEVKVEISVKDLYSNLMITKSTEPSLFFTNQGLIEFLAVTCGVNITQGDIGLKIESILSTFASTLFDIPSDMYHSTMESIRNNVEGWFKITR